MQKKLGNLKGKHQEKASGKQPQSIPLNLKLLESKAKHSLDAAIWSDLGVAYTQRNLYALAKDCFHKSLRLNPHRGETYFNLGNLEQDAGNIEDSINIYEQCVNLLPNFSRAWLNYGNALRISARYQSAEAAYLTAIKTDISNVTAAVNLGNLLLANGEIQSAITRYEQALRQDHKSVSARVGLGSALCQCKNYDEAKTVLHDALKIDNNSAEAHCNLGHLYLSTSEPKTALIHLERAIAIRPNFPEAISNIGLAKRDLGDVDGAIQSFRLAVSLKKDFTPALSNLAVTLKSTGKLKEALAVYREAMASDPTDPIPAYNASLILLQVGEFHYGWNLYENRWKSPNFDSQPIRTEKPLWTGQNTNKVVFFWPEQGIGDEVMFGALFEQACQAAPNSIFALDRRLVPIFRRSFPNLNFVEKEIGISSAAFDYHFPIGSLPRLFCNSIKDFQRIRGRYLFADPSSVAELKSKFHVHNKKICGISWKSSNKKSGRDRSMALFNLLNIVSHPNTMFVNLQYGDCTDELAEATQVGYEILNFKEIDNFNNIDGLCTLISCCDYIVSIDNSTVHLSGALGVPTSVLLPRDCDWRWTHGREKSLWYPSVYYTI